MKKVYSAASPADAHLVRGLLEDHGFKAVVQGEALWGARGELPLTPESAPSVWVADDADVDEARTLIRSRQGAMNPEQCANCGYDLRGLSEPRCPECGQPFRRELAWNCPDCSESIEGQFTHCWNCGAPRPEQAEESP
jgi:hypothetical protein